jgi:hypothetical protein
MPSRYGTELLCNYTLLFFERIMIYCRGPTERWTPQLSPPLRLGPLLRLGLLPLL